VNDGSSNPSSSFGSDGKLLTTLGGASVTFNGISAPILASFPGQLNVQIPLELSGESSATVVVTVGGLASALQTVPLALLSPGIFSLNNQGTGQGTIHIANTTIYAAAAGSIPGAQAQPANPGQFITIYCTGLGAVSNPPATGMAASGNPLSTAATTPMVTIGGIPATVGFVGLAPGFVGLYQVNAQVPEGVPVGNAVPVVLSIGDEQSNTVTMATAAPGNGAAHLVDLTWNASTSPNISGYNVYRSSTAGGPYSILNTTLIVGHTYTDTAVLAGQIYYYVATAVNTSNLESGFSTPVQVAVPSP